MGGDTRGQTMRQLENEAKIIQRLQGEGLQVLSFYGRHSHGKDTLKHTIHMWNRATVVVGVHGGALANMIFCKPETSIIEIGFRNPLSRHYAHTAAALDLRYSLFLVEQEERSVGSNMVRITEKQISELVNRVFSLV